MGRGVGRGRTLPHEMREYRPCPLVTYFLMSLERRFLLKGGMFFLLVISRSRSATAL